MDERLVAAGRKGGFIKWAKISKADRSTIMRKLAKRRWKNRAKTNNPSI